MSIYKCCLVWILCINNDCSIAEEYIRVKLYFPMFIRCLMNNTKDKKEIKICNSILEAFNRYDKVWQSDGCTDMDRWRVLCYDEYGFIGWLKNKS